MQILWRTGRVFLLAGANKPSAGLVSLSFALHLQRHYRQSEPEDVVSFCQGSGRDISEEEMSSYPTGYASEEEKALIQRLNAIQEEIVQDYKAMSPEVRKVSERLYPAQERLNAAIRKEMRRTAAALTDWDDTKHSLPFWIQSAGYYLEEVDLSGITAEPITVEPKNEKDIAAANILTQVLRGFIKGRAAREAKK